MTLALTKQQQAKILTPATLRLMQIIRAAGGELRVVGGAVRDTIMNRATGDIDFACTLPPERVIGILTAQHIKCVPTGLAHGTLTAVIDHTGYEITTLRRDIETDGRHAQVAYTNDWREDAARRDFTFNALYADEAGYLYDYFDGIPDAEAGYVRFIGDAQARIKEDVLRILRFFRFHAWFGKTAADATGLQACRDLSSLIPNLSAERVARETLKLLAAENPAPAWHLMMNADALAFTPAATDIARLETLLQNEKQHAESPASLTRLAALLPQDESAATATSSRLKLANRDSETLAILAKLPALMQGNTTPQPLRRLLYAYGPAHCRAALFLAGENIAAALPVIAAWENPLFPLKGEDLVKRNIAPGPRIGEILRAVENWWIENDFRPDRAACLTQLDNHGKIP